MFNRIALISLAAVVAVGCSSTPRIIPDDYVTEIDPDKLERERLESDEYKGKPTPDHVVAGDDSGIIIDVRKRGIEHDEQDDIKLQIWDVSATNTTNTPMCVMPTWTLMEFEYITDGPAERFVPAHSITYMGQMQSQVWIIDGVPVSPAPSGYMHSLLVRDVVEGAKQGAECTHIVDEEDIITEPTIEE